MDIDNKNVEIDGDRKNLGKEILQWVEAILIAVVLAWLLRGFVFERAVVDGSSMADTLYNNENLIVYKLGYFFHPPKKGDIIVFEHQEGSFGFKYLPFPNPGEVDYIKRVIAVPGDTVDITDDNRVIVNGVELEEPYAKGYTARNGSSFPITVPPNKLFVLGDNREYSSDSREIGLVDFEKVRGRAVLRIFPLDAFGRIS